MDGTYFLEAFIAYREPGDAVEGGVAESAIRGKEDRKNTAQQDSEGRKDNSTSVGARVSSFSL
jgi:hypothetical protein